MNTAKTNKKVAFVEGTYGRATSSQDAVARGLCKLGYSVCRFNADQVPFLRITKNTPVRATITTFRKILDQLGVPWPENVDIPDSLMHHAHRKVWKTTLGALRKSKKQVFIKSLRWQKAFSGQLMFSRPGDYCYKCYEYNCHHTHDRPFSEKSETSRLPNNFEIFAQEVVDFGSEYRYYIMNRKVYHSNGSYDLGCNELATKIAKEYKDCPAAYCIDIGSMTRSGEKDSISAIVEINEMYSCGLQSGVKPEIYAKMLAARWNEIVGK